MLVADIMDIDIPGMRSPNREKLCSVARSIVWFVAHKELGYTSTFLGRLYNRHHSTILAGVKKIEKIQKLENAQTLLKNMKKENKDIFELIFPL